MAPRGKRPVKNRQQFKNYKSKFEGRRKNGNSREEFGKRRFYNVDKSDTTASETVKRQKLGIKQPISASVKEESSSEEETLDYMDKLIGTIAPKYVTKQFQSIDTSDDDSAEEATDSDSTKIESKNDGVSSENQDQEVNEIQKPEEEYEFDLETEKEDQEKLKTINDPYMRHLNHELSDSLLKSVRNEPMNVVCSEETWPLLGDIEFEIPKCDVNEKMTDEDRKPYAIPGSVPKRVSNLNNSLYIKSQISNNIVSANKCGKIFDSSKCLSPLQMEIFSIINNYQDFYYPHRTFENAEEVRFIYCLHIANHLTKSRTKVLHHNAKLLSKKSKNEILPESYQDQGLVRPKILVIVPFRDAAYRIITMLIDIIVGEDKSSIMNKKRFVNEFTGHEIYMPTKYPKPEDYQKMFTGNSGDEFKIGISVTKKSFKLFADFYSSDLIIASPLGIRYIIGAEGEEERDYDFLASIELLIFDQTEVFLMQNWMYVFDIMKHMHLQLKKIHGNNLYRTRKWSLHGLGKYYRQTLIFSSFMLPEFNNIFNNRCFNYRGKAKVSNSITHGSICEVSVTLKHIFRKFSTNSYSDSVQDRLDFFTSEILPNCREAHMKQTMIFVSSYFDYVKLRNYFKRNDISFVQICEYSKDNKVARARDIFFHGDTQILLYTERYHFFHRIRVKGIRHLIFYQPPVFPHFYTEMCNLMQEKNMNKKIGHQYSMSVTVLYSQFDVFRIASILGTEKAANILHSEKNVHVFT